MKKQEDIYRPQKLTLGEIREGCVYAHKGDPDEVRICAINEEFRQGMDIIEEIGRSVTFFGSARTKPGDEHYIAAKTLAARVVTETGCAIVTGGGPGIMGAGNEGAFKAGGESVGFTIKLPMEQTTNPFVTQEAPFYYFFTRKVALTFGADAYVVFPGGFGTMDEAFEILTLIQTKKSDPVPVVFYGVKFWSPLLEFIKKQMLQKEGTISASDIDLITLTDDLDQIIEIIRQAPDRHDKHKASGSQEEKPEKK